MDTQLRIGILGDLASHLDLFPSFSWCDFTSDLNSSPVDIIVHSHEECQLAENFTLESPYHSQFVQAIHVHDDFAGLESDLQEALTKAYGLVVGYSSGMTRVIRLIRAYSHPACLALNLPLLITGEHGTGKELVARAFHRFATARDGEFVALNLGGVDDSTSYSALFGHVEGAFTDAMSPREGAFKMAKGGILFLDEITECSDRVQAQLLRALQERVVKPLGSDEEEEVDVTVIAATNRDLLSFVNEGKFRADLLGRLDSLQIKMIPLRDRLGDLHLLTQHLLREHSLDPSLLDIFDLDLMRSYAWPGNIREFRSFVLRVIVEERVGGSFVRSWNEHASGARRNTEEFQGTLEQHRNELDRRLINSRLLKFDFDTNLAAESLGISRRGLYSLAERRNIDIKGARKPQNSSADTRRKELPDIAADMSVRNKLDKVLALHREIELEELHIMELALGLLAASEVEMPFSFLGKISSELLNFDKNIEKELIARRELVIEHSKALPLLHRFVESL